MPADKRPRSGLTEAQRRELSALKEGRPGAYYICIGSPQRTIDALQVRGLVDCVKHAVTGQRFYRVNDAGRAALTDGEVRGG